MVFLNIKMENEKKILAQSFKMKNGTLDDDYTLFDNGEVLHEYDRSIYPGGFNLKRTLKPTELTESVKQRLLSEARDEDKQMVMKFLEIDI